MMWGVLCYINSKERFGWVYESQRIRASVAGPEGVESRRAFI